MTACKASNGLPLWNKNCNLLPSKPHVKSLGPKLASFGDDRRKEKEDYTPFILEYFLGFQRSRMHREIQLHALLPT